MESSDDGIDPDSTTDAVNMLEDLDYFLHADSATSDNAKEGGVDEEEACALCSATGKRNPLRATTLGHVQCLEAILAWWAGEKGVAVAQFTSERGANAAHVAAKQNGVDALAVLVRYDAACLASRDDRGATPAHVAAFNGSYECLKAIVEAGGATTAKASDGATPLHFAAARGQLDCVQCLAAHRDVNVNEKTKSGATPVYFAAQEGHLDVLQWLVTEAKANPTIPSSDGMTPLHAACQTGQLNCTHWLVRSAGCSAVCRTDDGATPVHFAATKGHVAILQWMLHQRLADGSERDDYGATPVHDAAEQNQLRSLEVFAAHSTDMHPKDVDGFTPMDLADERNNTACSEFLKSIKVGLRRGQSVRRPAEATPELLTSVNQQLPSVAYRTPEGDPSLAEKKETKWKLFHKKKSPQTVPQIGPTRGKLKAFFTVSRNKKIAEQPVV